MYEVNFIHLFKDDKNESSDKTEPSEGNADKTESKEEILKKADEYDKQHGVIPIEIHGTETMEIDVDLNRYNSIKLNFIAGGTNV